MNIEHPYPNLEETLSFDRFSTYLAWAGGERNRAVELYSLNTLLCECLYVPLQILEVTLRNRIHHVMSAAAGDTWFDLPGYQLNPTQTLMIAGAREVLTDAKKPQTPGAIVAAMTFGFWTAMFSKEYENLWQTTLHKIAKREDGKGLQRKNFAAPLGPIRMLRNRVAHHEPILYWSLPKHYANIQQITRWLSPVAADWSDAHSRFDEVFPKDGITLIEPTVAD